MPHRALTLKYRPQVFSDMVGQDHVSSVLARALESGRIAHAYLFTGARGVGKTTSARILAKALNCERRGMAGAAKASSEGGVRSADPCNECTSCIEITSGVSLDVVEIDGASNRGIADVQALRERVRFTPTGGRYRVVIIDEVHQLSNDAFAALLKTLEEPPPHVVFVFATTDPQKLPETIRSRTQRFDFARVPLRKVAERLESIRAREAADPEGVRFTLTEGAALLIAYKGEGSIRDAVSALDQVVSTGETEVTEELVRRVLGIADREAFFDLAGAILLRDPPAALHALHRAFEKGVDARDLAEGLSEHLRHILILRVDPQGGDLVAASAEELARMRAQGEGWSESDLLRLLKLASEASWPMRESPQPLIHLEAAVLQMATLEPSETLAALLERLESLEKRLGSGAPSGATSASGSPSGPTQTSGPTGPIRPPAPSRAGSAPPRVFAPPPPRVATPRPPNAAAPEAEPSAVAVADEPASAEPAPIDSAAAIDPDAAARWAQALGAINGRKRMLGAFLEESALLAIGEREVTLAMDDLHRAVVDVPEHRRMIAEELQRAFGRPLEIRCAAPGPAAAARPAARRPDAQELKPMIDRAIEWFDGERIEPRERAPGRSNGPRGLGRGPAGERRDA